MKRSILMLLVIGVAIIFFGCEKMDPLVPESNSDQEISALKAAKVKRTFEGICTPVIPPAIEGDNEWYDATDDWRTTGTTIWDTELEEFDPILGVVNLKGTAILTVDATNPHDENRGKWEMNWEGILTPTSPDGSTFDIVATAEGVGVEGKVKGMKAYWTYTMDFDGTPETLFYVVEGNIDKPQGPIKKD